MTDARQVRDLMEKSLDEMGLGGLVRPGFRARLDARRTKGYRAMGDTWMLEYARGWIPTMLPTGSWDNLFSNLDLRALFRLYGRYGVLCARELARGKV